MRVFPCMWMLGSSAFRIARNIEAVSTKMLKRCAECKTRFFNQITYEEQMKVGDVVWYTNKLRKERCHTQNTAKIEEPFLDY